MDPDEEEFSLPSDLSLSKDEEFDTSSEDDEFILERVASKESSSQRVEGTIVKFLKESDVECLEWL
jgi:hypothetical protein